MRILPSNWESFEAGKSKSGGFMDLNYDHLGTVKGFTPDGSKIDPSPMYEAREWNRIALSHYYRHPSGDMIADPDMEIAVYQDMIEALTYQDTYGYRRVYPEKGKVDLRAKKELNSFLGQWLSNLINQGHKIKEVRS